MKVHSDLTAAYRKKHSHLFLQGEDFAAAEREVEQEHEHTKKRSRHSVGNSKSKKQYC